MPKSRIFWGVMIGIGLLLLAWAVFAAGPVVAQGEATPLPINIPTRTAPPPTVALVTPSRTPTASGSAVVEVKDKTVPGNVRQAPDINSEVIGKLYPGKFYPILSKTGKWLQILYGQPNPDSTGWVFEDIVNITGPSGAVPTSPSDAIPTANEATAAAKTTAEHLTATPGAVGSATALQGSATGVVVRSQGSTIEPTSSGPKPTFTFPPPLVEATLAPRSGGAVSQAGLPPIVPIIGLLALGTFGLLISGLRRL